MNDGNRSKILALGAFVVVLIVAVVVGLVLGGGDDSDDSASTGPDCSTESSISTDTSKKPDVTPPEGDAPDDLECVDIVEGDGATAEPGDQVTVQYVGIDFDSGKQFDASWDNGQPFPFQLGAGSVIDGWDEGVVGMKVGGRRELIIPPDLAYGAQGQPPSIKPDATLVFVVDLLDAQAAPTTTGTATPAPTGG
ncbi:MAG: FKBP-type peptidyl-prolyl cis-trans isomerase [Solirubrobacterales bacterium]